MPTLIPERARGTKRPLGTFRLTGLHQEHLDVIGRSLLPYADLPTVADVLHAIHHPAAPRTPPVV